MKKNKDIELREKIKDYLNTKEDNLTKLNLILELIDQERKLARLESARQEREKVYQEVKDFSFDLVEECNPDCSPEEHQYHQGTWDSYLKLERWAESKLKEEE